MSRDQVELHWVQRLPNLFDLLGQRTGDEECELSSAVQAAGSGGGLVVRFITSSTAGALDGVKGKGQTLAALALETIIRNSSRINTP